VPHIELTTDLSNISEQDLDGFFVGWPNKPTPKAHLQQLQGSSRAIIARETGTARIIGVITALTDDVLFGYISSLEVLPEYQGQGIGKDLVSAMLEQLKHVYAIDLVCDPDVQPFYAKTGLIPYHSMIARRRENIV
jgi:ribosomal protein S18 acetylase RimI-like enzyme